MVTISWESLSNRKEWRGGTEILSELQERNLWALPVEVERRHENDFDQRLDLILEALGPEHQQALISQECLMESSTLKLLFIEKYNNNTSMFNEHL